MLFDEQNQPAEYYLDPDSGEMVETSTALVPAEDVVMVRADAAPTLLDPKDLPDFENMDAGFSLAQQYLKFTTPGQTERGILLGFNEMKSKDGKSKPIAIFQNKQGVWANAGDNLIGQIYHLPKGTALQVTYKGDVKSKNNFDVKTFEVRLLNPKPVAPAPVVNVGPGIKVASKSKQPA